MRLLNAAFLLSFPTLSWKGRGRIQLLTGMLQEPVNQLTIGFLSRKNKLCMLNCCCNLSQRITVAAFRACTLKGNIFHCVLRYAWLGSVLFPPWPCCYLSTWLQHQQGIYVFIYIYSPPFLGLKADLAPKKNIQSIIKQITKYGNVWIRWQKILSKHHAAGLGLKNWRGGNPLSHPELICYTTALFCKHALLNIFVQVFHILDLQKALLW